MTIADRIKFRREELDMTQEELASKLGLRDKSSITRIEKSGDDVSMKNIIRIATALSTTPRFLIGYQDTVTECDRYTTLNQIYYVLKNDKQFDDRAIPVIFGYDTEDELEADIKERGPILIPYSRLEEISNVYNLSPDYLAGKTPERNTRISVSDNKNNVQEEISIIKAYRNSSDDIKNAIKRILEIPIEHNVDITVGDFNIEVAKPIPKSVTIPYGHNKQVLGKIVTSKKYKIKDIVDEVKEIKEQ